MPLRLPHEVVSKAYARLTEGIDSMRLMHGRLAAMLDSLDHDESEENAKNHVRDFLKGVWYQTYQVNTKDRVDLVIHRGEKADSPVGVVLEAKRPANKAEFPKPTGQGHDLRCKALYELLYYYLDLYEAGQRQMTHIIMTNGYVWYIMDENDWATLCLGNKKLLEDFRHYAREKRTDEFYNQIAKPFFEQRAAELPFVCIDFRQYQQVLADDKLQHLPADKQRELTLLYKLFSPQHLLKLSFQNTGNQLDKGFYLELLHILGLREVQDKDSGKLLINRLPAGQREAGSLLENAISQLKAVDLIRDLDSSYGTTAEERYFNVGMELVITWLNRVLFLKLLEAQLKGYHAGEQGPDYAFLAAGRLKDFDDLNTLFFQVLATYPEEREPHLAQWQHIPYLNSSLFEVTDLERKTLRISNLSDSATLKLHPQTVLKDAEGRREDGKVQPTSLDYLLRFLDAYNFSSEGGGEIQEQNKSLISAKVLGLFFEKINGYQDGSIYTPGYITEYMCRVSLRELVLARFNDHFGLEAEDWQELQSWCAANIYKKDNRQQAGDLINGLRICDPAVGSGHFLVSALNELIACKAELGLLTDEGKPLPITIEVSEDELVIFNELTQSPFEYRASSTGQTLAIQRALFHEKQTIIENCLFGVDINPNSVKICRLRLWIELLKHAYYFKGALQTLPNIDINIKEGNSLLSRFPLRAELNDPKLQRVVNEYRGWVQDYKNTTNKEVKRGLELKIKEAVSKLNEPLRKNDPRRKQLDKLSAELYLLAAPRMLDIPLTAKQQADETKRKQKLEQEIEKLSLELKEEENSVMWSKAFEWRFAFPEVLNEEGDFMGFDLVVGNPPYIRQEEIKDQKKALERSYEVYTGTADIYQYFFELGLKLCATGGQMGYIVANKWMLAGYGEPLRRYLGKQSVLQLVDFGDLPVFDAATTYPCIIRIKPEQHTETHEFQVTKVKTLKFETNLEDYILENQKPTLQSSLKAEGWILGDLATMALLNKLENKGVPLGEYVGGKIYRGVLTGYNKAFVIDAATRTRLIQEDPKSAEVIKPFLAGKDIKRYARPEAENYLILFPKGITKANNGDETWLASAYPALYRHFIEHIDKAKMRSDQGDYWWELRACDYYDAFTRPKIILPDISLNPAGMYDVESTYVVNTAYLIPIDDLTLLAIFNSTLVSYYYRNIASQYRGGYLRFIYQYMYKIPIVAPNPKEKAKLESLVQEVLDLKAQGADTSSQEAEIDHIVYGLYGLTEDEIRLVEGVLHS